MRQIKVAWSGKIRILEEIIFECGNIENRRAYAYVKVVEIIQNLKGLFMTYESGLIAKDNFMVYLDKLKQSQETKFYDIANFSAEEINKWKITFVDVNEEYSASILQLQQEAKEIEEIFIECVK